MPPVIAGHLSRSVMRCPVHKTGMTRRRWMRRSHENCKAKRMLLQRSKLVQRSPRTNNRFSVGMRHSFLLCQESAYE